MALYSLRLCPEQRAPPWLQPEESVFPMQRRLMCPSSCTVTAMVNGWYPLGAACAKLAMRRWTMVQSAEVSSAVGTALPLTRVHSYRRSGSSLFKSQLLQSPCPSVLEHWTMGSQFGLKCDGYRDTNTSGDATVSWETLNVCRKTFPNLCVLNVISIFMDSFHCHKRSFHFLILII